MSATRTINVGGVAQSVGITGTAAAPGANVSVVNFAGLVVAGTYRLQIIITLTGTAETQLNNLSLRTAGAPGTFTLPTLSGVVVPIEVPRFIHTSGNLTVSAVAAATAGSIYTVTFIATRIDN